MKFCSKCKTHKEVTEFHKDKTKPGGLTRICKPCKLSSNKASVDIQNKRALDKASYHSKKQDPNWLKQERARTAKWKREHRASQRAAWASYNAAKLKALPAWADRVKIKEFYANCPKGMEVDHIIPLRGENICGLHIETNLQYLTRSENASKRNRWENK